MEVPPTRKASSLLKDGSPTYLSSCVVVVIVTPDTPRRVYELRSNGSTCEWWLNCLGRDLPSALWVSDRCCHRLSPLFDAGHSNWPPLLPAQTISVLCPKCENLCKYTAESCPEELALLSCVVHL